MTQSVGNLVAELSLNWAKFEEGMSKSVALLNTGAARINTTLGRIQRDVERFNTVGGALLTTYVVKMGVDGVRAAAAFGAQIKETAEGVGLTTNAVQELTYALQKGGASGEASTAMLERFTRVIGDAANGSLEAQRALERLNITTDDLRTKSIDQLFVKATDELSRFASVADRNSAVVGVFGRQALSNADALAVNAQRMAELRQEAHEFGNVMGGESIEASRNLRLELERTEKAIKISLNEALVSAGPILVWFAQTVKGTIDMVRGLGQELGFIAARTADEQYDLLLKQRLHLSDAIEIAKQYGEMEGGDSITKLRSQIAQLDAQLEAMRAKYRTQRDGVALPEFKQAPAAPAIKMAPEQINLIHELEKARERSNRAIIVDEEQKARAVMESERAEYEFKLKQARLWTDDTKKGTAEQQKAMAAYYDWLSARTTQLVFEIRTPVQKLGDEWQNVTKQMQDATARWMQSATDALVDFVKTGKFNFRDFADSVITDLIRIKLQQQVTAAFGEAFNGLGGALSSLFGGSSTSSVPARAAGGPVTAGQMHLVGERGPELFMPNSSGYVVPNHRLSQGGGEAPVSVQFNINTGVSATVQAELRNLMPQITEDVKSAVADGRMRGGKYAQAFAG